MQIYVYTFFMMEINLFAAVSFVDLIRKPKLMKICNRITSKLFTFQNLKNTIFFNKKPKWVKTYLVQQINV